jgi:nucleotide-binding universal stress UspA family protein
MSAIVCAVRSGEASRHTQEHAISLARDGQRRLIFFFTVDPASIAPLHSSEITAMASELEWLGKVLLRQAQHRAERAGVKSEAMVGRGNLREALESLLRREKVELLVIGAPRAERSRSHFTGNSVEPFAQAIEAATGVQVVVVRADHDHPADSHLSGEHRPR